MIILKQRRIIPYATAFIKPLLGKDEEAVLKALRTNTAYLQREVASRKGRTVLKMLLVERGHTVSADRLADGVGGLLRPRCMAASGARGRGR